MENRGYVPDSIPADLGKSWHIPRPTLARSSKSSQGSMSSNSTESVRSGSLLLTAASLAQIHQAAAEDGPARRADGAPPAQQRPTTRDANIRYYLEGVAPHRGGHAPPPPPLAAADDKKRAGGDGDDDDAASVASSTHFTVVNVGRSRPPPRRGFCRRHQLTVLVLTMSALFTVGILTAILLLEMRAKNQRY